MIPGRVPDGGSSEATKAMLDSMAEIGRDTAKELSAERKDANQACQLANERVVYKSKVPRDKKAMKARASRVTELMKSKGDKKLIPIQLLRKQAKEHSEKNPELKEKVLILLRERIKPGMTSKEIQETIDEFYSDPTLADDVMDFLEDTTEGELNQQVKQAKEELNESKGREIVAGRNISTQAREAAEKGLGTPTTMRDMYREMTGNPRDANTMFGELSQKYAFQELKKVVGFLLHSLGADLKAKGSSIPRGELHNLLTETRTLQAIMGVYRFFQKRMGLMEKMFAKNGLTMPKKLSFEMMAKSFMDLAGERYPSADKVLGEGKRLGIEDWILAKIIAFSQFRDSIRELAMSQIFRSLDHRNELFNAIIEALEDLEDELEEQQNKEEEEEGEEEEVDEVD